MNLYIDANIFLDFYRLSSTDIEELRKLVVLIEEKQISLLMPEQTLEEISRNRDSTVAAALKAAQNDSSSFNVNFPAFLKKYPEHDEIRALLKEVNTKHAELMKKADESIKLKTLDADGLINDLVSASLAIETTPAIFNKAINRFRKGNPPGKNKNSVGDEINWETLKSSVADGEDIYLVSGDIDYRSEIEKGAPNSFLKAEWEKDKKSDFVFFSTLTGFFKSKYPDIKIAADFKTKLMIERLSQSGNFAATHSYIGALTELEGFNSDQAEQLIEIAELNNQVKWILIDDDVGDFYRRILKENGPGISETARITLENLLQEVDEYHDQDDGPDDDEIPF